MFTMFTSLFPFLWSFLSPPTWIVYASHSNPGLFSMAWVSCPATWLPLHHFPPPENWTPRYLPPFGGPIGDPPHAFFVVFFYWKSMKKKPSFETTTSLFRWRDPTKWLLVLRFPKYIQCMRICNTWQCDRRGKLLNRCYARLVHSYFEFIKSLPIFTFPEQLFSSGPYFGGPGAWPIWYEIDL